MRSQNIWKHVNIEGILLLKQCSWIVKSKNQLLKKDSKPMEIGNDKLNRIVRKGKVGYFLPSSLKTKLDSGFIAPNRSSHPSVIVHPRTQHNLLFSSSDYLTLSLDPLL